MAADSNVAAKAGGLVSGTFNLVWKNKGKIAMLAVGCAVTGAVLASTGIPVPLEPITATAAQANAASAAAITQPTVLGTTGTLAKSFAINTANGAHFYVSSGWDIATEVFESALAGGDGGSHLIADAGQQTINSQMTNPGISPLATPPAPTPAPVPPPAAGVETVYGDFNSWVPS